MPIPGAKQREQPKPRPADPLSDEGRYVTMRDGDQVVIVDTWYGYLTEDNGALVDTMPQPVDSALEQTAEKGWGEWWMDLAVDVPQAVTAGVAKAATSTLTFAPDLFGAETATATLNDQGTLDIEVMSHGEAASRAISDALPMDTTPGKLLEGITKFGVGMLGAGKLTGPLRSLLARGAMQSYSPRVAAALVDSRILAGAVNGALGDFVVTTGDDRGKDLIATLSIPLLSDAFDLLSTEPDASIFETKLKATAQGGIYGISVDLVMKAFGLLHKAKWKGDKEAGKDAIQVVIKNKQAFSELELDTMARSLAEAERLSPGYAKARRGAEREIVAAMKPFAEAAPPATQLDDMLSGQRRTIPDGFEYPVNHEKFGFARDAAEAAHILNAEMDVRIQALRESGVDPGFSPKEWDKNARAVVATLTADEKLQEGLLNTIRSRTKGTADLPHAVRAAKSLLDSKMPRLLSAAEKVMGAKQAALDSEESLRDLAEFFVEYNGGHAILEAIQPAGTLGSNLMNAQRRSSIGITPEQASRFKAKATKKSVDDLISTSPEERSRILREAAEKNNAADAMEKAVECLLG